MAGWGITILLIGGGPNRIGPVARELEAILFTGRLLAGLGECGAETWSRHCHTILASQSDISSKKLRGFLCY